MCANLLKAQAGDQNELASNCIGCRGLRPSLAAGVAADTTTTLPTQLSDVRVYVNNTATPLI
jgi:hypothetical protein